MMSPCQIDDTIASETKSYRLTKTSAAGIFSWMHSLPNAMPDEFFSAGKYPRTRAWLERYDDAITKAKDAAPQPDQLEGLAAVDQILNTSPQEEGLQVEHDPLRLSFGDKVQIWPVDTGYGHKDSGTLVKLSRDEVAILRRSEQGNAEVRIHFPRWNFAISRLAAATNGS